MGNAISPLTILSLETGVSFFGGTRAILPFYQAEARVEIRDTFLSLVNVSVHDLTRV